MPRGYRCIVLALVGWLVLCGAGPADNQYHRANSSKHTAPSAQATPLPTPTPSGSPTPEFTAYSGYDPDPCYHDKNHDAADLCAQWRASKAAEGAVSAARYANVVSAFGVLLSLIGTVLIWLAWQATKTTNRIAMAAFKEARLSNQRAYRVARTASDAQLRPYLSLDEFDVSKQDWTRDGRLVFRLKNYGQTPAIGIRFESAAIVTARPVSISDIGEPDHWDTFGDLAPQAEHTVSSSWRTLPPRDWQSLVSGGVLVMQYDFFYRGVGIAGEHHQRFSFTCSFRENGKPEVNMMNAYEQYRKK